MSISIELKGIEKNYPGVVANHDVDISIAKGSIHAIIGENGAGKSTLMKILYGMVRPDAGSIAVEGKLVHIKSPQDSILLGIGMVHQHFMLADNATVLENIVLGSEPMKARFIVDYDVARENLNKIIETYGLAIYPDDLVGDLGVGGRQRVEIAKVLFRGAKILILDEPTAVLVPQEVDDLFENLKVLTHNGLTILFISHKLDEVLAIADEITVMRRGTTVVSLNPKNTNKKELAEYMIGGELPSPRPAEKPPMLTKVLEIKGATFNDRTGREVLHDVNLDLYAGEILGVAGVEGNGQSELIELIMGLGKPVVGSVLTVGIDTLKATTRKIRDSGVGYIPQDRQRDGLLMPAPLWENRILGHQKTEPISDGRWIDKGAARKDTERIVKDFDVRTPSINVRASALSGGNQQKFIVGREMAGDLKLLIAAQPTRGVDVGAQAIIWDHLIEARLKGAGVMLVSADLDELFQLSDRIAVIFRGTIVDYLDPHLTTPEQLGLAMTGEKIT